MTSLSGVLTILFDSDWRCGTGRGRHGGVDLTVARDTSGLPFVPAETAKGLWREACERAAWGLSDGAANGPWHDLVRHLFGSTNTGEPETARGRLSVRPARLTNDWLNALAKPAEATVLPRSLVITRFGVRIADSGVAEDDTLRLVERARAGLTVAAPFHVVTWQPEWAVSLLLQAGASLWHHTGGSRRRGAGACSVTLSGLDTLSNLIGAHRDDIENFFLASWVEHADVTADVPSKTCETLEASVLSRSRQALVTITTELPVLAARSVEGNVTRGLVFVPGSALLPLVAEAIGPRAAQLIRDGQVSVTDAFPALLLDDGTGDLAPVRLTPLPRTLLSGDKGRAWTRGEALADALQCSPDGAKAVGGWGALVGDTWHLHEPHLSVTAHNSVDDNDQRPLENGLYTFEAIPAGQLLQAAVVCEGLTDAEWQAVLGLGGPRELGRYASAGYGQVHVRVADVSGSQNTTTASAKDAEKLGRFAVHLVSDILLVDERGHASPTAEELARQLGDKLLAGLRVRSQFVAISRRESWASARALPRPSMVGLAAGSVVEFDVEGDPLVAEAVDAVLDKGVGARRAEGFGRLQRLGPVALTAVRADPGTITSAATHDPATDEPAEFGDIRRAAWEAEILQRIQVLAANPEFRAHYVKDGLTRSQLGALREAAVRLPRDPTAVSRWLTATQQHDTKSKAWTAERLDAITAVASPDGDMRWADRLVGVLNVDDALDPVPQDLGGVHPALVSAALLTEILRLAARDGEKSR